MLCERGKGTVCDETEGSVGFGAAVWKFSASLCKTHKLGLDISKGEAGAGFWRAVIRCRAALVAASADDVRSMGKLWGKKATVQESRIELVKGCNIGSSDNGGVMAQYTNHEYHVVFWWKKSYLTTLKTSCKPKDAKGN